jgi:hypothetical protein
MRRLCKFAGSIALLLILTGSLSAITPPVRLKLITPASYLSQVPVLVRVEALDAQGGRERNLWDGDAVLTADPASVTLSTNRVHLRNGLGSVLVVFGGGDFNLTATLGSLQATRALSDLSAAPVTTVGGTLAGATTWSGVVRVTGDVTIPQGSTLTILSNTLVLVEGVASGTTANDFLISGAIESLGTEDKPVTITCATAGLRWGQIRHNASAPSLYRHTIITRAGRAPGEGHTATAPVIRPTNSRITFDSCSLTDHADAPAGTPGKIGFGNGSDLTFINCLFQRARMGPEIQGTALLCTNTWIMDMRGPDDSDGIYVHDQAEGQQVLFSGCVVADGDDDGIDTLGSVITVENCIIREWNNLAEDAKAISALNGAVHVRRSIIVDSTVGIAAKSGGSSPSATPVLVTIDHTTLVGNGTNTYANRKSTAVGPNVHFNITNSILWDGKPAYSDFEPNSSDSTNFTIVYCNLSEPYAGTGNITSAPLFVDAVARDFHLRPYSPSIDSGDPASPNDPDGSPTDQGCFTFQPPQPVLRDLQRSPGGAVQFTLEAYTNRNYVIDLSFDAVSWNPLKIVPQLIESNLVVDTTAADSSHRLYRARLPP